MILKCSHLHQCLSYHAFEQAMLAMDLVLLIFPMLCAATLVIAETCLLECKSRGRHVDDLHISKPAPQTFYSSGCLSDSSSSACQSPARTAKSSLTPGLPTQPSISLSSPSSSGSTKSSSSSSSSSPQLGSASSFSFFSTSP